MSQMRFWIFRKMKCRFLHEANVVSDACTEKCKMAVKTDVVSGVDEDMTDENLLHVRMQELKGVLPDHLTSVQCDQIAAVFLKHQRVWLRPRAGQAKLPPVKIRGVNGPPIKMRLRPLSPSMKVEVDKQLDDMLKAGVIEPSRSPCVIGL